jgi:replicative superfamily II helicase
MRLNSLISVGNLIYSAPTSGGKTLVSEILMLRKIALIPGGTIFFIVPFIALAEEKAEYLRTVWGDMFIGIKSFHGEDGGQALTKDIDIAVCTIER